MGITNERKCTAHLGGFFFDRDGIFHRPESVGKFSVLGLHELRCIDLSALGCFAHIWNKWILGCDLW